MIGVAVVASSGGAHKYQQMSPYSVLTQALSSLFKSIEPLLVSRVLFLFIEATI